MVLLNYEQQKNNLKILVEKLQAKKVNSNVIIALVVNSIHESYLNPWTLEGAVNPGPPQGAQGTGPGGGLWQWTPYEGKITLGDWDGQIDFMMKDSTQYIAHSAWWNNAGIAEPTNNFNNWHDFLANSDNLDAVTMTRIFIGNWERPGYSYGAKRFNVAPADVDEIQQYVGSSGISMPVPQWPFNYAIAFNQQPYEIHQPSENFYDHDSNQAYDIQAQDGSAAAYMAPVDVTTIYANYNSGTRVLMTDQQVYFADGKTGYLAMSVIHDNDASMYVVGKKIKAGEVMGHMGTQGAATGIHMHLASARFNNYTENVPWIRQGPYSSILNSQIPEIRGDDGAGNVSGATTVPGFPNPWTTIDKENSLGRMTANNVFSVTDAQKAMMINQFDSHVNIDAFHYVDSSSGGTPAPPKPNGKVKHLDWKVLGVMGIFN